MHHARDSVSCNPTPGGVSKALGKPSGGIVGSILVRLGAFLVALRGPDTGCIIDYFIILDLKIELCRIGLEP